jgi:hypothetical protein
MNRNRDDRAWVLLDAGNVFLVDEPLMGLVWAEIFHEARSAGRVGSFDALMEMREKAVVERRSGAPHDVVAEDLLTDDQQKRVKESVVAKRDASFLRYCFPVPGAGTVLEDLSRSFRLAMAANQPEGSFRCAMDEAGLLV